MRKAQSRKRRSARPRRRTFARYVRVRMIINPSKLDDDVLLSERELAAWLGIAPVTLRSWRRQERSPPWLLLEGRPRYPVGAARQWLAEPGYRRARAQALLGGSIRAPKSLRLRRTPTGPS
jgi:hypothetical protein